MLLLDILLEYQNLLLIQLVPFMLLLRPWDSRFNTKVLNVYVFQRRSKCNKSNGIECGATLKNLYNYDLLQT